MDAPRDYLKRTLDPLTVEALADLYPEPTFTPATPEAVLRHHYGARSVVLFLAALLNERADEGPTTKVLHTHVSF